MLTALLDSFRSADPLVSWVVVACAVVVSVLVLRAMERR
jgi:hypothetical protein